jgi:hypothetical protein
LFSLPNYYFCKYQYVAIQISHEELEKAVSARSTDAIAKKFANLTIKGDKFFIGKKKVIPVKDHSEFLKGFYDNPETRFQGCNRIFAKIAQDSIDFFMHVSYREVRDNNFPKPFSFD